MLAKQQEIERMKNKLNETEQIRENPSSLLLDIFEVATATVIDPFLGVLCFATKILR